MNYLIRFDESQALVVGFANREVAESNRQGKHSYVVGSLAELESTHVPLLVLQSVVDGRKFSTRQRLEKEVWKAMETMTEQEQKDAKQKAADEKKAAAEAKKAEAAKKKEAAEKAKADKKAAEEAKKAEAAKKKEEAEKAKADKKAAAEAKKAEAAAKKQQAALAKSRIGENETITVLVEGNPKREGSESHKRFALYQNGMTVGEFIKAGGTMADINWDFGHRFISLTPAAAAAGESQEAQS